jgi:hypothetical protein
MGAHSAIGKQLRIETYQGENAHRFLIDGAQQERDYRDQRKGQPNN